jgi:hypothetical protein
VIWCHGIPVGLGDSLLLAYLGMGRRRWWEMIRRIMGYGL